MPKAILIELFKSAESIRKRSLPLLFRVFVAFINALVKIENFEKASEIVEQMKLQYPERIRTKELSDLVNMKVRNELKYFPGRLNHFR